MVTRNPNEYERIAQERSEALSGLEESRAALSRQSWIEELERVNKRLSEGYLCKSDKEDALARKFKLQSLLGIPTSPYNG